MRHTKGVGIDLSFVIPIHACLSLCPLVSLFFFCSTYKSQFLRQFHEIWCLDVFLAQGCVLLNLVRIGAAVRLLRRRYQTPPTSIVLVKIRQRFPINLLDAQTILDLLPISSSDIYTFLFYDRVDSLSCQCSMLSFYSKKVISLQKL